MKILAQITSIALLIVVAQVMTVSAGEVLLNVKHTPQVDVENGIGLYIVDTHGNKKENWDPTKICGPVCVVIEASYLNNFNPSGNGVKGVVDWMVEKKFKLDDTNDYGKGVNDYYGYNTRYSQLIRILKEYYGLQGMNWLQGDSDENILAIKFSLENNKPVIIGTYTKMINSGNNGHFMVVDGLRDTNNDGDYLDGDDEVHVVDPGRSVGSGKHLEWYKVSQLRNAWTGVLVYIPIALYSNNTTNQPILTRYNQSANSGHPLGNPKDNGGGLYVHDWFGITLQDFYGDNTGFYHGNTSIIENTGTGYLLKEGFWDYFFS